jgi:hypothetical protein
MLSEAQQKRVWEGMLSAEIRAKYFADFSGRYQTRQKNATLATLFFSSGAVVTLLGNLPSQLNWLRLTLAACAALTSIYSALSGNNKKAFDAATLHERWGQIFRGYRAIWEDVEAEDAHSRLSDLDENSAKASQLALTLENDQKVMNKWQNHTEREYQVRSVT